MNDKPIPHKIEPVTENWLKKEIAEQDKRYEKIRDEMKALGPDRDRWVAEFLQRIQTRGFNMDGDLKVKIPSDKIPTQPNREFKVVF